MTNQPQQASENPLVHAALVRVRAGCWKARSADDWLFVIALLAFVLCRYVIPAAMPTPPQVGALDAAELLRPAWTFLAWLAFSTKTASSSTPTPAGFARSEAWHHASGDDGGPSATRLSPVSILGGSGNL